MRTVGNMIVTVIVTVLIVGGGTYFYLNQKVSGNSGNLSNEVKTLQEKVASLERSNSQLSESLQQKQATDAEAEADTSPTPSSSPSVSPTPSTSAVDSKNWKTFNSTKYTYSVKYPTDWEYKDTTASGAMNAISFKAKTAKDYAFAVTIQKSTIDYSITQIKKNYSTYIYKTKSTADVNGITFTTLSFESKDGKTKPIIYLYAKDDLVYYFASGASSDTATNSTTAEMVKNFTLTK